MTIAFYDAHIEPSAHVYATARNKSHGSGPASRRQALMLAIMAFATVHQKNRRVTSAYVWVAPALMRLLYVKLR